MRIRPCRSVSPASVVIVVAVLFAACSPGQLPDVPGLPSPTDRIATPQTPDEREGLIAVDVDDATVRPERRDFSEELMNQLDLPDGFEINVFADDLDEPRILRVAENGDAYVTERGAGRVTLLRDSNGDGTADDVRVVSDGLPDDLEGVHGLAVRDNVLYIVTENELFSADIQNDGSLGEPALIMDDIPDGGQHPNRTISFGPDGTLYLSVGSTCNACVEPKEEHATMLTVNLETGEREIYAEGLRNTIGFGWHPETGEFWGLDHNSDHRGGDWPPEELNRIDEGLHYGWPFCGGDREVDWHIPSDPEDETRQAFCAGTEPPVLTYQGHAAPMQMNFYEGDQFPEEYRGDAFATMRGSWNRNPPVGYEVVRIRFDEAGQPTEIEPFVTGWLLDGGEAHFGRLTGLEVSGDGSLLITDDTNGIVYRIAYNGGVAAR